MSTGLQTRKAATPVLKLRSAGAALLQRKCACGRSPGPASQCGECRQKPLILQRWATNQAEYVTVLPIVHKVLRSPGQPLDAATRAFMESRFGHDFSQVRIHTDARAAESAQAVSGLAYTVGQNIVFAAGQYTPRERTGKRILAHELAHVIQQGTAIKRLPDELEVTNPADASESEAETSAQAISQGRQFDLTSTGPMRIARQAPSPIPVPILRAPTPIPAPARPKIKIDYKKAERANKGYATSNSLGWESKLETVAGGTHKDWADLWEKGRYNEFADAVANFQSEQGWPKKRIDGILGLQTWAVIGGLGEAIAGIRKVVWKKSEDACTVAVEERIERGYKLAKGEVFELPEDKTRDIFNVILQSIPSRMFDLDEKYRGTGPAGAMVYSGLGTFVSEADIWAGKLQPGAAIQVWGSKKDYDLLRAGEIEEKGKKRRIRDTDAVFYGTSFVFVRYDTENLERMLIRHFGSTEWKEKSDYEVWVAANVVTTEAKPAEASSP